MSEIDANNDALGQYVSKLTDDEICEIIREIYAFNATGLLASGTRLRDIAQEIHDRYKFPNDVHMVENAVLYEAARRFFNTRITECTKT